MDAEAPPGYWTFNEPEAPISEAPPSDWTTDDPGISSSKASLPYWAFKSKFDDDRQV